MFKVCKRFKLKKHLWLLNEISFQSMNFDSKLKRIALCDRSMLTGVFCLTVNTCEKVQKYLCKIFRGSSNCFLWQATDVGFATFLHSWLVHGAALCVRKSGRKFQKEFEGANLRASVTRCRWEEASTAELRVGAACSFFTSTFSAFLEFYTFLLVTHKCRWQWSCPKYRIARWEIHSYSFWFV